MFTSRSLLLCADDQIAQHSNQLTTAEIDQLIEWLDEKNDDIRYKSLLILKDRSHNYDDVFPYWDVFVDKMNSTNAYQRSIGVTLVAENVRWDNAGKFDNVIDLYLSVCDDEKLVPVRQCIQNITQIIGHKRHLAEKVVDKLISMNLLERKESQRKLLLIDILSVLLQSHNMNAHDKIASYYQNALKSGILDERAKRQVLNLFRKAGLEVPMNR